MILLKTCPNCGVKLNRNAIYCRICGSSADGKKVGDFKTEISNLFHDGEWYYYVYTVGGIQQVVRGTTADEVRVQTRKRNFPWISNGKPVEKTMEVKAPKTVKNPFLKTSAKKTGELKSSRVSSDVFLKASARKTEPVDDKYRLKAGRYDVYIPRIEEMKGKRNPSRSRAVPYDQLPREYGVVGLSRKTHQGRTQWAFKTNETKATIYNDRLESLRDDVISRELNWDVVDSSVFMKSLKKEEFERKRRTEEILAKRRRSISFEEKMKLNRGLNANTTVNNGNSTRLDRMFR